MCLHNMDTTPCTHEHIPVPDGMVSGLTYQSSGPLVWQAPVVNCNTVSYYTVTMTMYSDGTLVEMGTTTQQNYTLTRSYGKCSIWSTV